MALPVPEKVQPQFLEDEADMPGFGRSDGQIADDQQQAETAKKVDATAQLGMLGQALYSKFTDVERKRLYIEDRWLEDLRQFHGRYDSGTERALIESESCALFLNITKPKTHAFSARIMDMVLPTDDSNWGLDPTPVPEIAGLASGLKDAPAMSDALMGKQGNPEPGPTPEGSAPPLGSNEDQAPPPEGIANAGTGAQGAAPMPPPPGPPGMQPPGAAAAPAGPPAGPPGAPPGAAGAPPDTGGMLPDPQGTPAQQSAWQSGAQSYVSTLPSASTKPMMTPEGAPVLVKDIVTAVKEEAEQRCEAMKDEIEDQLAEASYNGIQRQAIEQMAKLGSGIIMGPVILDEWRTTWNAVPNAGTGKSDYVRKQVPNTSKRPGAQWVDCWNFYPDMSANEPSEWEFAFVQYLVNAATFKKMAKRFNFMEEPVREALAGTPFNVMTLRWMTQLRDMSETNNAPDQRYRLLRYYGELSDDDLRAVGKDPEKMDLGDTIRGVVWLCDRVVLKIDLNPLDSGDMPFSIAYCDKDEASPFGRGIPRLMRGEQESVNAAWRMKHDNAGLSVGPQTVMRVNAVTPADGDYHMKPKKIWYAADDVQNVNNVFAQFAIDSHQAELDNLLQLGIRFADDVTQLPLLMQGDQAPNITQTAQGMSLLYNASTVVLRRSVKFYDDYVTEPMIGRFYEWNMQFNDREDIKGDFRAIARGTSTLLDKEQQGKALDTAMQLAMQPTWQPYTDMKKLYREALKSKRIADIMLPDDAIEKNLKQQADLAMAQAQAGKQATPPPAAADPLAQQKLELAQKELTLKSEEIQMRGTVAQAKVAGDTANVTTSAQAHVAAVKIKEDAANARARADIALKAKMGTGI